MNTRTSVPTPYLEIGTLHLESCKSFQRFHNKLELALGSQSQAPSVCVWLFHNQNWALGQIIWQKKKKKKWQKWKAVGTAMARRPSQMPGKDYWASGPSCWQRECEGRYESKSNCRGRIYRTRWLFTCVGCGRGRQESWFQGFKPKWLGVPFMEKATRPLFPSLLAVHLPLLPSAARSTPSESFLGPKSRLLCRALAPRPMMTSTLLSASPFW